MIDLIQNALFIYVTIGTCILLLNVLILGMYGDKWLKKDLLIVISWPLDIVNLLGILIGVIIQKFKK